MAIEAEIEERQRLISKLRQLSVRLTMRSNRSIRLQDWTYQMAELHWYPANFYARHKIAAFLNFEGAGVDN